MLTLETREEIKKTPYELDTSGMSDRIKSDIFLSLIGGHKVPTLIPCQSYPPSSQYLCAKDKMSEARPLPSQTTTGTGGSSLRYSRTIDTTLGPPSTTRPTTGTPWPSPATQPHLLFKPA